MNSNSTSTQLAQKIELLAHRVVTMLPVQAEAESLLRLCTKREVELNEKLIDKGKCLRMVKVGQKAPLDSGSHAFDVNCTRNAGAE